jgi:acyl-CoA oxidase
MDITFSSDPKLSVLLPVIYHAWQDDTLTKNEFDALSNFINTQEWLTKAEKTFLQTKVTFATPPMRTELANWKELIDKSLHVNTNVESLTELGFFIANAERPSFNGEEIIKTGTELARLESGLGIMGTEVISGFRNGSTSLTQGHNTIESFNVKKMTELLDGNQAEIINKVKALIGSEDFRLDIPTDVTEYREKVLRWCQILADNDLSSYAYPVANGGKDDIEGYFAIMETLSYHDLSLVIKFGVQFGLWGMSILSLGTEKHYDKYLKDVGTLALPGCFAMTETHHGSNVKGIHTTATYNHQDRTFTVNTPEKYDRKEYIGNAANHGEMATVFAKLIIDGKDYGVNA